MRIVVALGGGVLALHATGALHWLFAALAAGLVVYGVMLVLAVHAGVWFEGGERPQPWRLLHLGSRPRETG